MSNFEPPGVNDPEYWRTRAEEALAAASKLKDPQAKMAMRRIAEQYRRLAHRATARKLGSDESSN